MTIAEEQLKAWEALTTPLGEASWRPVVDDVGGERTTCVAVHGPRGGWDVDVDNANGWEQAVAIVNFIAAAREAVPALIVEVRRLRSEALPEPGTASVECSRCCGTGRAGAACSNCNGSGRRLLRGDW